MSLWWTYHVTIIIYLIIILSSFAGDSTALSFAPFAFYLTAAVELPDRKLPLAAMLRASSAVVELDATIETSSARRLLPQKHFVSLHQTTNLVLLPAQRHVCLGTCWPEDSSRLTAGEGRWSACGPDRHTRTFHTTGAGIHVVWLLKTSSLCRCQQGPPHPLWVRKTASP